jgi:hypothetical protein
MHDRKQLKNIGNWYGKESKYEVLVDCCLFNNDSLINNEVLVDCCLFNNDSLMVNYCDRKS